MCGHISWKFAGQIGSYSVNGVAMYEVQLT